MLPLNEKLVMLDPQVHSPEEAIRLAGSMLVEQRKVEQSYVEAMVNAYREIGAYIVIAPMIAVPHARPDQGVNEQCVSIVRLKSPIAFGHPTNDPVRLVCAIGGVDKKLHMQMLRSLISVIGDNQKLQSIMQAQNYEQFMQAIQ